jgi:hypothetical protein
MVLIAVTHKLWMPQSVFPQIPVFEFFCQAPSWLDWICIVSLIAGLVILLLASNDRWMYFGCALGIGGLVMSICLDQHRLQAWAYQLLLFLIIWLGCPKALQSQLTRFLVISIYFFSALGKLDYEFLHSVGQQMLGAIFGLFGMEKDALPGWMRLILIAMFPLMELAIAIGLIRSKSRRVAGWAAIFLHLSLLAVLGPFGLNHRLGVLVWNLQFAGQAYILFVRKECPAQNAEAGSDIPVHTAPIIHESRDRLPTWLQWGCTTLIATTIALPVTERIGLWDHWPSWALYAPHSSRVRVEVAGPGLTRLPGDLIQLTNIPLESGEVIHEWVPIPLDAWSLQTLDTPIYPQARFQLGVAREIASIVDSEYLIRVVLMGCANRFSGVRSIEVLESNEPLAKAAAKYWFNTRPRD